jgi:hypothetical protein
MKKSLNVSASQTISKQRVADYGEVYTAPREVNAMLDLVKQETERIESRFLEPARGNGNFLIEVLTRKLAKMEIIMDKLPRSNSLFIKISQIIGASQQNVCAVINTEIVLAKRNFDA